MNWLKKLLNSNSGEVMPSPEEVVSYANKALKGYLNEHPEDRSMKNYKVLDLLERNEELKDRLSDAEQDIDELIRIFDRCSIAHRIPERILSKYSYKTNKDGGIEKKYYRRD